MEHTRIRMTNEMTGRHLEKLLDELDALPLEIKIPLQRQLSDAMNDILAALE